MHGRTPGVASGLAREGIIDRSGQELRLAFVATTEGKEELWVRDLDSLAARALPGTAGAEYPFWSPVVHRPRFRKFPPRWMTWF